MGLYWKLSITLKIDTCNVWNAFWGKSRLCKFWWCSNCNVISWWCLSNYLIFPSEARRRKWLENNPESSSNEDPVVFDTSIVPWWAWIKRYHLPEAELLNGMNIRTCLYDCFVLFTWSLSEWNTVEICVYACLSKQARFSGNWYWGNGGWRFKSHTSLDVLKKQVDVGYAWEWSWND